MAGVEPSFDGFTDRPHYRMSTPTMQRKPRESNTTRCRAQSLAGTLHTTVDSASIFNSGARTSRTPGTFVPSSFRG